MPDLSPLLLPGARQADFPEPPRATRVQSESIRTVSLAGNPPFFRFFRVEPALHTLEAQGDSYGKDIVLLNTDSGYPKDAGIVYERWGAGVETHFQEIS